jgi:hypothetical protein
MPAINWDAVLLLSAWIGPIVGVVTLSATYQLRRA